MPPPSRSRPLAGKTTVSVLGTYVTGWYPKKRWAIGGRISIRAQPGAATSSESGYVALTRPIPPGTLQPPVHRKPVGGSGGSETGVSVRDPAFVFQAAPCGRAIRLFPK